MGAGGGIGSTDNDWLAEAVGAINDRQRIELLRQHATCHHHIGPGDVRIVEFACVSIDEPNFPRWRQHRSDRDEPERRSRIFGTNKFASLTVIPEGPRIETGIHHQDFCLDHSPLQVVMHLAKIVRVAEALSQKNVFASR